MKFSPIKLTIILLTAIFVLYSSLSFSQEGGGGVGYGAIDRARAVAGPGGFSPAPPGVPGAPPPGISPEDWLRFQTGNQALTGQPSQQPPPQPEPVKMITVVEGELVISAKSGEILQKPERKEVPETLKDNYYDDGTHGDEFAGDGIYSNVVVRKDVISKSEYKQRLMLETLIEKISKDSPVEFYRLYVASHGFNPDIPSYQYWKIRRNEFVDDYKTRVLAPYRDENGVFYEVYEPPPPPQPVYTQGQIPGQPQGPQNVGLPTAVQGQIGASTGYGQNNMGIGGSSYFGEQNRMK